MHRLKQELVENYKRRINCVTFLQLSLSQNTEIWTTLNMIRVQLIDELCELDMHTRIQVKEETDPRSVISIV